MSDITKADERLKEHARKMRSFLDELDRIDLDELDRIDGAAPDGAADNFRLPYATIPQLPKRDFKLTFPA